MTLLHRPARARLLPTVLLGAALALTACGGGGDEPGEPNGGTVRAEGPADAQTATVVSVDGLTYDPGTVEAVVGTLELTHRNASKVPHDLTFEDEAYGVVDAVTGGQSKAITLTFSEPGTYVFVCTYHSGQVGQVVVS